MHTTRVVAGLAAFTLVFGSGCNAFKRFAYEGFGRDRWQQPERVIATLGIEPGDRVADLGAGGGYFTFRLADGVGPTGTVYAVDIDPGMLGYLETRAAEDGYANVEVIEATVDDARLPAGGVDLLFTCNTYHHIGDRTAYFRRIRGALKPDGRVAIIDMNGEGWFAWLFGHAAPPELIRSEMEAAGYRLQAEHPFIEQQSFLIFTQVP